MAAKAAPIFTSKPKFCDLNVPLLPIKSQKIAIFQGFNMSFVTESLIIIILSHRIAFKIIDIPIITVTESPTINRLSHNNASNALGIPTKNVTESSYPLRFSHKFE